MSPCGTFALIGSAGGAIDMYNLQSGKHRQRFPARLTPAEAKRAKLLQLQAEDGLPNVAQASPKFAKGWGRHKGAVTGLAVDGMNRVVISCSDDGKVKVGLIGGCAETIVDFNHSFGILRQVCYGMRLTGIP